jgi:DNA-binding transcriptional regulator YdaS (Cro superfamily)
MDTRKAIEQAIQSAGSQDKLALEIGVTQQAIAWWLRHGRLPAERVLEVERVTGVSRHDLRPDIYPRDE